MDGRRAGDRDEEAGRLTDRPLGASPAAGAAAGGLVTPVFRGVGVALVTLFADDGTLDAAATGAHAARLVDLGVQAVLVAGTTGEPFTLDRAERTALIEAVAVAIGGRVPLLAGTGAATAEHAVTFTTDACALGVDAVLALSPPDTPDPRPYYDAVAVAAGEVPVLAYHFPRVSPPGISLEVLDQLPVAGMKDSSGDPDRLLAELSCWGRPVYPGSSALLALAGPLGCPGAIVALANAEPEQCIAAFAGDAAAQLALAPAHLAARRAFPAGIKALTAARFGTATASRL